MIIIEILKLYFSSKNSDEEKLLQPASQTSTNDEVYSSVYLFICYVNKVLFKVLVVGRQLHMITEH